MFLTPNSVDVVKARKEGRDQGRQKSLMKYVERAKKQICMDIVRFFYDGGIPFHLITVDSFHVMYEFIGQFGPGLKPPFMY